MPWLGRQALCPHLRPPVSARNLSLGAPRAPRLEAGPLRTRCHLRGRGLCWKTTCLIERTENQLSTLPSLCQQIKGTEWEDRLYLSASPTSPFQGPSSPGKTAAHLERPWSRARRGPARSPAAHSSWAAPWEPPGVESPQKQPLGARQAFLSPQTIPSGPPGSSSSSKPIWLPSRKNATPLMQRLAGTADRLGGPLTPPDPLSCACSRTVRPPICSAVLFSLR